MPELIDRAAAVRVVADFVDQKEQTLRSTGLSLDARNDCLTQQSAACTIAEKLRALPSQAFVATPNRTAGDDPLKGE
jgi:hypothetical protein